MYQEGLREDIRSEIGSTVFSSIDVIMQTALDVEEGESLFDTESVESDELGKRPKKKAKTKKNHNDDPEDEEPDADQDGSHADYASE
ncbi:hypothetical protein Bca52824_001255 [Brassica carinata]|uniref:Uncharacterized protein n=1 Tax=Brassica carinata TaxID=52824 RepID=A0A8X7WJT1_BRACI|nr:hypothetical protein Bca52824_001255 [Brassica carinata]